MSAATNERPLTFSSTDESQTLLRKKAREKQRRWARNARHVLLASWKKGSAARFFRLRRRTSVRAWVAVTDR